MNIWAKIKNWWNSGTYRQSTSSMTTEELKEEYVVRYDTIAMGLTINLSDELRMGMIEDELKLRKIYIYKGATGVSFSTK